MAVDNQPQPGRPSHFTHTSLSYSLYSLYSHCTQAIIDQHSTMTIMGHCHVCVMHDSVTVCHQLCSTHFGELLPKRTSGSPAAVILHARRLAAGHQHPNLFMPKHSRHPTQTTVPDITRLTQPQPPSPPSCLPCHFYPKPKQEKCIRCTHHAPKVGVTYPLGGLESMWGQAACTAQRPIKKRLLHAQTSQTLGQKKVGSAHTSDALPTEGVYAPLPLPQACVDQFDKF